jgi:oligoendopeptidase F
MGNVNTYALSSSRLTHWAKPKITAKATPKQKAKPMTAPQEINWDLTQLFPSITDPSVDQAISRVKASAEAFEKRYRGKIAELDAKSLLLCLQEVEAFEEELGNIGLYASLSFSANMTLPQTQALYDKINKLEAQLGKQLAFFSLELGALIKAKPEVIGEAVLSGYQHI